jgi:hypothetical protein
MTRRPTRSLVAWSLAGLVVGHQATYFLVYRDPSVLASALSATGHGWLWLAPLLLASAPLTALVLSLRESAIVRPFRSRLVFLALIQATTFLALEVAERATTGASAGHLIGGLVEGLGWQILLVGVVVQVVFAALLALASKVVERVIQALRASPGRQPRHRARALRRPVAVAHPRLRSLADVGGPRAPPVHA